MFGTHTHKLCTYAEHLFTSLDLLPNFLHPPLCPMRLSWHGHLCQGHLCPLSLVTPMEVLAGDGLPLWEAQLVIFSLLKATAPITWFSLQGSLLPLWELVTAV